MTYYELRLGATTEEKFADIRTLSDDLVVLPFNSELIAKLLVKHLKYITSYGRAIR